VFKRLPEDANKLSVDVKIAPPEQLAIGSLVFTLQNTKRWIHWNKIAQTDFGKVAFIGKQDDKGGFDLTEYQENLTTAPKSVLVDIQVQDMPHHAKFVYGAGLFAGKPPRTARADLLTSSLTSSPRMASSAILSGTMRRTRSPY
jgi:hypothetical protein